MYEHFPDYEPLFDPVFQENGKTGEGIIFLKEYSRFGEVLAILRYFEPDEEAVDRKIERLIKHFVEGTSGLSNPFDSATIYVPDNLNDYKDAPTPLGRFVKFGSNPNYDTIVETVSREFGEGKISEVLRYIFCYAFSSGMFTNTSVIIANRNEMAEKSDADIAKELAELAADPRYRILPPDEADTFLSASYAEYAAAMDELQKKYGEEEGDTPS
jgi:hypothetical protein